MSMSSKLRTVAFAAIAAVALQAPEPAAAQTEAPLWTPTVRPVERRQPTEFAPVPSDVNPAPPSRPVIAGPAATRGSALADFPEGETITYNRPIIVDPGTIQSGEQRVRFAEVTPLALEEQCTSPAGVSWLCGRRALTALRDLVRQRQVQCVETGRDGDVLVARCRIGRTDLSAWLVEQGWARPSGDNRRLQELSEAARQSALGQFGSGNASVAGRAP